MHADKCGGCTYQGMPSYEQLKIKDDLVKTLIDKKGLKVDTLLPIEKSPKAIRLRRQHHHGHRQPPEEEDRA